MISHGGVGALLLCHLKRVPISRAEDQPDTGGGCVYSFNSGTRTLLSGWRPIEHEDVRFSSRGAGKLQQYPLTTKPRYS